MENFAINIKKIRAKNNWTQQDLADKLYVTRQAISKWELGKGYPDTVTLQSISKKLEVSVDALISDNPLEFDNELEDNEIIRERERNYSLQFFMVGLINIIVPILFHLFIIFKVNILNIYDNNYFHFLIINIFTLLFCFIFFTHVNRNVVQYKQTDNFKKLAIMSFFANIALFIPFIIFINLYSGWWDENYLSFFSLIFIVYYLGAAILFKKKDNKALIFALLLALSGYGYLLLPKYRDFFGLLCITGVIVIFFLYNLIKKSYKNKFQMSLIILLIAISFLYTIGVYRFNSQLMASQMNLPLYYIIYMRIIDLLLIIAFNIVIGIISINTVTNKFDKLLPYVIIVLIFYFLNIQIRFTMQSINTFRGFDMCYRGFLFLFFYTLFELAKTYKSYKLVTFILLFFIIDSLIEIYKVIKFLSFFHPINITSFIIVLYYLSLILILTIIAKENPKPKEIL